MRRAVLWSVLPCTMAAAGAVAQAEPPAACPPAPVRIVHSRGAPTEYGATYPGIPDLCLMRRADGAGYAYFGAWRAEWPGAGLAYPALKTVLAGPKGTRVTFVTRSVPGMQWDDTLINQGTEPLTVGGRIYQTVKLAHERAGIEGNFYHSIITSWRDVATGMTLKVVEDQIAGDSYGPDTTWTAVRVEALP
jgi:hypothetical protein